jgi:hypothetical protein
MFCPFYFKFPLFDRFARFILKIDDSEGTELREADNVPRFLVKMDQSLSSGRVKIIE